jgi:hypothetical protein
MKANAIASVAGLTGRTVTAFMSGNHLDPDVAAERCSSYGLAPRASRDPSTLRPHDRAWPCWALRARSRRIAAADRDMYRQKRPPPV